MRNGVVIGWDVGGAHLKAARLEADGTLSRVVQHPCPLWEGLDRLEAALKEAGERVGAGSVHGVTMTGEMADLFSSRSEGVERLAALLESRLDGRVAYYAGAAGFVGRPRDARQALAIASANWHATARLTADCLSDALLVDVGSTTTDIALIAGGQVRTRGATDAQRLAEEELVYTGAVRTPAIALATRAPFAGEWVSLMAEHFASAADVHRLTGDLPENTDQQPAADRGAKTAEASARRLARMIGRDLADAHMDDWRRLARWLAAAQLARIEEACARLLSRGLLDPAAPVVGAGVGRFLAARLARRLERPYLEFAALVPADPAATEWLSACAPAVAVGHSVAANGGSWKEVAMWVVKLGGSLAADPLLRDWLDVLADEGRGRVIVVPGGGPFADQVRDAQSHWRFDEAAAHRMAILAMEQYALMLAAIEPRLLPAAQPDSLYAVLKREGVAVWLPAAMLGRTEEIAPGWEVSSDSLAAWFACRMSAQHLVLVKSCELPQQDASAEDLSRLGIVDPAFPEYIRRGCFTTYALSKGAYPALRAMLRD